MNKTLLTAALIAAAQSTVKQQNQIFKSEGKQIPHNPRNNKRTKAKKK